MVLPAWSIDLLTVVAMVLIVTGIGFVFYAGLPSVREQSPLRHRIGQFLGSALVAEGLIGVVVVLIAQSDKPWPAIAVPLALALIIPAGAYRHVKRLRDSGPRS